MTDFSFSPQSRTIRLHGKIPRIDHVGRSYPMRLRDGTLSRLQALSYFSSFKFSTSKMKQIQPQDIPFCGVYLIQELTSPDGDANAGEIRFRTFARLGFSVIIQNNDPLKAEDALDLAHQTICDGLFSDPTFYNNDSFKLQGITSGSSQHVFGSLGADNELPIAELRYEITCDLGTIVYEPRVPDVLEVINVKTAFPVGGSQAEQDVVQQVSTEYDLDQ